MGTGVAVFETAIGPLGIAWSEAGVVGVQLPAGDTAETARLLRRRFPGASTEAMPAEITAVADRIVRLLAGEPDDLGDVLLDLTCVSPFERSVYEAARAIPPGATATYGEVAAAIGAPGAARQVGRALGSNPFPVVVPCHRVVAAGGRLGGFSAPGGSATKRRLLAIEGALLLAE